MVYHIFLELFRWYRVYYRRTSTLYMKLIHFLSNGKGGKRKGRRTAPENIFEEKDFVYHCYSNTGKNN